MMLRVYLWKEWREQRWTLLAVAGSMAVLSVTAWLLMPDYFRTSGNCLLLTFLVALLLGLVLVVGELMPGEARRGQADFLRRLPGSGALPVIAKILIAAMALGLCTGGALLCGWCLQGSEHLSYNFTGLDAEVRGLVLLALAAGAWCLAVSSWLPRGTLSLPATVLFWLVCGLPVGLILSTCPGMTEVLLQSTDRVVAQWLLLGAGLPIAWHSMTRALRFRRDPWGRFRAVALAAAVFVPFWGWAGVRVWQWEVADPTAGGFQIRQGFVGVGGRFAFLNTETHNLWSLSVPLPNVPWPDHVLVVDLVTGEWRQVGGANWLVQTPSHAASRGFDLSGQLPQDWLAVSELHRWNEREHRVLDGRTGEDLGLISADRLPADRKREGTPFRLPDNRRAWLSGNQLMVERTDGGLDSQPWSREDVPVAMAGYGIRVMRRNWDSRAWWFYDITRRKAFKVAVDPNQSITVAVRPGLWALRRLNSELVWLDPETGVETRVEEFQAKSLLLGVVPDGRVLLVSPRLPRLALVDPEKEAWTQVGFTGQRGDAQPNVSETGARTPAGDRIFFCYRERKNWLAVLRDGTLRGTAVLPSVLRPLAACDEESVLVVVDYRRIERLWWDSDRREVLWPRPAATRASASPPR